MSDEPTPQPAPPARRRGRKLRWLAGTALAVVLLLGVLAGGVFWLAGTAAGTAWLLPRLPGVTAEGVDGALLGPTLSIDRLQVRWAPQDSARVEGLRAEGLQWQWRPAPGAWIGLRLARLAADRVQVETAPAAATAPTVPLSLPPSLELPLQLAIEHLQVGELRVGALAPVTGLRLRLRLAGEHRIDGLALAWDQLLIDDGALSVAAGAPFTVSGSLAARQADAAAGLAGLPPWAATLQVGGTLGRVTLDAALRAGSGAGAPALAAQAALAPFQPWPLLALSATTQALDLSALATSLPRTRLGGRIELQSSGAAAPLGLTLQLDNALAGRWDAGLLPLRRATLQLGTELPDRRRVLVPGFDFDLGDGGRWRGSGQWQGDALTLQTQLDLLRPRQLHGAAPVMALSGPLRITLRGLPAPDAATPTFDPGALMLALDGRLSGRVDSPSPGAAEPLALRFDLDAGTRRLELRTLRAESGAASATLQGEATLGAAGWQLRGETALSRFDPRPWLPGPEGAAWRRGPHRLSAEGRFDLALPADAATLAPAALLRRIAGTARLQIADSLFAGVPLQGNASLERQDGADPRSLLQWRAALSAGGNRVQLDGRADPVGDGRGDRLQAEVDAPDIGTLAPLARLLPALDGLLPRKGRVTLRGEADGRWPALRTRGELGADELQVGEHALGRLRADWRLDGGGADPALALNVEASALASAGQRVDRLRALVQGSLARHRIELDASTPIGAPPAVADLLARARGAGTQALLRAEGRWQPARDGGGQWRADIARLQLAVAPGAAPAPAPAAPAASSAPAVPAAPAAGTEWLDLRGAQLAVRFGAAGELLGASAEPGRARLADALTLAWQRVVFEAGAPQPAFTLRGELEPFAVAPLLARLQPTQGWRGDLRLRGRIDVSAGERFDADVVIERTDGDLQLGSEAGALALGLGDLRLALDAHNGIWVFTQAMSGRMVGEVAGAVRARTGAGRRWPAADAPLDGVIQARVANLGIWDPWVPPGWRLAGTLTTSATIEGRFGAPAYSGRLDGRGIGARNLLLGVMVSDGELAVALQGEQARIERATLKGGEGTLTVSGGATFGAKPAAALKLAVDRFRVLGRVDRRLVASGGAEMSIDADTMKLDGKLRVDEGLFDLSRADAPSLGDDVVVVRPGAPPPPVDDAAAPRRTMRVELAVDLGERLRIRGRGLDATLQGQLRITTPGNRLAINGSVRTVGGTYAAYGQKLQIERGVVTLSGAPDSARLDVLALRAGTDIRVGVSVSGTVLAPRVRLYSDPDMGETEKLSWMVLGRAPDGLGRADIALLQSAALALLAGEQESKTEAVLRQLGIDEFSVRQTDGEVRQTVITIGKQLSDRWYVGYERGVNAVAGSWQLVYRVAQRFTLRAQAGDDSAIDLIWTWRRN